jgi:dipeptidyl aminopeptidase/acylaminoacyl peptidase
MLLLPLAVLAGASFAQASAQPAIAPHPITLDDAFRLQDVGNPRVSPDGQWVAYTVTTTDLKEDKRTTNVWMVNWDGSQDIQLTYGYDGSASAPQWSPDGKYLSFLSSRKGPAKGNQVWVLDRRGGEARQLTEVKGELSGYAWSPDGRRLLLTIATDGKEDKPKDGADADKDKPTPIVIDRYHFKEDVEGYVTDGKHTWLYLYDVASRKLDKLTADKQWDEENAVWSPDGARIAFVSNHDADPDRSINSDVFVVAAQPNSPSRRLTTFDGEDGGRLAWSPDGKQVAFLRGSEPKYWEYTELKLAVVAADGNSPARVVDETFDRPVAAPQYAPDGKSIDVLVADDRNEYPASVNLGSGAVHRQIDQQGVTRAFDRAAGHEAVMWTTDAKPGEIYALVDGALRPLTHHNDALLAELTLAATRDVNATSQDGTPVHGLITLPPDPHAAKPYPMLLFIHGGPDAQDAHSFDVTRQLFAAHGYAVLNVNYRGSNGRGAAYQRAIAADWGHYEVQDLNASVDEVIHQGLADPNRLAVGGWSYGGILTDYMIASTNRFKAASSGAGTGNALALYGVDEYIIQYDNEFGPPWKNLAAYIKIGYPFFHADRIHTPTLFLGGEKDFNVPVVAGEQMYEALQSLHVPSELIIFPGQYHGFTRPSFIRDRYQDWFHWYDKWVLGKSEAAPRAAM